MVNQERSKMQFKTITKTSRWTQPLLALLKADWPDAYQWLTDVIDDWSLTCFPQIIVALENGAIVGYYSLVEKELVKDTCGYTPWLGTLFVAPKYRGRHYSPQLIEHACQHVKQMGCAPDKVIYNEDVTPELAKKAVLQMYRE